MKHGVPDILHTMSKVAILGVSMYWALKLALRVPKSHSDDKNRSISILLFGERHQPVKVGCTRPVPMCVGNFCFGSESVSKTRWVHRYIFDDILGSGARSGDLQLRAPHPKEKAIVFVENPRWDYRRGVPSAVERDRPCVTTSLMKIPATPGRELSGGTNLMKNMVGMTSRSRLRESFAALEEAVRRSTLRTKHSFRSGGSNFDPTPCGMPSALSAVRNHTDACNRGSNGAPQGADTCPLDTNIVEIDHFDSRMVTGPYDTIINPFPLLLRCPSFVSSLLGECKSTNGDWVPSTREKRTQAKCLHYILGPASPLSPADQMSCASFVKDRVLKYLKSIFNRKEMRYVPSKEDQDDYFGIDALKTLSGIGTPQELTCLMSDMFAMAHQELAEQIRRTEDVYGVEFVQSLLRLYCNFNVNVYTRPQIRNSFHALWVTGTGERVQKHNSSLEMHPDEKISKKDLEEHFYKNPESVSWFPFTYPFYTRICKQRALCSTRLINLKSSLTDSITDVRMILRMIELGGSGERSRAIVYGGMAHTKNILRFFSFAVRGKSALPTFCIARPEEQGEPTCACTAQDVERVRSVFRLTHSRGISQEYVYPDLDQWVAPTHAEEDMHDFQGVTDLAPDG